MWLKENLKTLLSGVSFTREKGHWLKELGRVDWRVGQSSAPWESSDLSFNLHVTWKRDSARFYLTIQEFNFASLDGCGSMKKIRLIEFMKKKERSILIVVDFFMENPQTHLKAIVVVWVKSNVMHTIFGHKIGHAQVCLELCDTWVSFNARGADTHACAYVRGSVDAAVKASFKIISRY